MFYKHYSEEDDFNLKEVGCLTNLIDDLSYDFIEWVKLEWFRRVGDTLV